MAIAFNAQPIAIDRCILNLDANNSKSYSPNVHPYPLDIYAWTVGTNGSCTIARDTSVVRSPANGIPLAMTMTANDPYMATYQSPTWTLAPAKAGETWTVSGWVKTSQVAGYAQIFIFGVDATGTYNNLGGVGGSDTGAYNTPFTSTEWTRISVYRTFTNASVTGIQVRLDGTDVPVVGQTIWWDGLQIEKNASATTFNPRTNAGGSTWTDPVRKITATNYGSVPFSTDGGGCFDMTSATGTPSNLGFTFSTNVVPRVGNFAFSCWTKSTPASPGQVCLFSNAGSAEGFRFGTSQTGAYVLCGLPYNEGIISWATWNNAVWHHVVAVFDRTGIDTGSPRVAVYLDSVYQGALALSSPQIQMADVTPGLVRNPGTGWFGKLAIFAVYSGHITSDEVNALFNSQRGRFGV